MSLMLLAGDASESEAGAHAHVEEGMAFVQAGMPLLQPSIRKAYAVQFCEVYETSSRPTS